MADIAVEYIDHLGTDLSVVNAARVSFDRTSEWHWEKFKNRGSAEEYVKSFPGAQIDEDYYASDSWMGDFPVFHLKEADRKLIVYLAKHNHEMPFAHPHITVRVKAPVPIARQAFKSKIGFVESEESRRYIKTTPEVYVPDVLRSAPEGSIKQGSGEAHPHTGYFRERYQDIVERCIDEYEDFIRSGVCPEQARFVLPQGAMVNWVWTGSLLAFARFYNLRIDSHAQQEVQILARKVGFIVGPLFPVSWKALIG